MGRLCGEGRREVARLTFSTIAIHPILRQRQSGATDRALHKHSPQGIYSGLTLYFWRRRADGCLLGLGTRCHDENDPSFDES